MIEEKGNIRLPSPAARMKTGISDVTLDNANLLLHVLIAYCFSISLTSPGWLPSW
jgi:hypothetical protein